ncbi:MAG: helix-hairpin-helix domain-containing protein [Sulfurovaceae bacterium]|nr:helix-hairpin-helix domain-containing protein [Sulfurovaceae bacterium]
MLKQVISLLFLSSLFSFAMSGIDVQKSDKKILGCIKGIGDKRLNSIITYRKENNITKIEDILNISGIGRVILRNIKQDIKKKSCLVDKQKAISNQTKTQIVRKPIRAK